MPKITVDAETYGLLRTLATEGGVPIPEVVRRAAYALRGETPPEPERESPNVVVVYAEYRGHRFGGSFDPGTGRLVVTTGELAGSAFASPSAAASAVVDLVNPRGAGRANGWLLWHVAETGQHLDVLRTRPARS